MIDKQIMKLPGMKKMMLLLAGLAVLQAIFVIGQAYGLATAITNLWEGGKLSNQGLSLSIFFFSFLGRQGIIYLRDKKLDSFAYEQIKDLRQKLLTKLFHLGPQVIQSRGTGNMTTIALDGIGQVETYLQLILAKVTNMMIIPWLILFVIFWLDWRSGLVLLIVFPLIILFMIILGYAAQSKAEKQYQTFQFLSNHFIDSLRGIDTLKLFGLSKAYGKSIFSSSERFRKATMDTLKIAILSTFALDFFTTLSVAVVAVFLGLRLLNEQILLFPALTVLILAPEYFLPIRDFSNDYHATLDGKNAMTAIGEVLVQPEPEISQLSIPPWTEKSTLRLHTLAAEQGGTEILSDLSFEVKGYQKIGIIGMSGSGKSTLINLLSGFLQPQSGTILLDEQATTSFKQTDWQKQLIYIPQSPYIFHMSLRENICFYHPTASDEEVTEALRIVGLTEVVKELPEGLETFIGEGARSLSGGQAQRVALARAFLDRQRKILLFDEPTAHLDIETEIELKERMLPLMQQRLVFFATHRLHWMKEMDYILVIENGRIVEQGTLETLQKRQGAFVRLTKKARGQAND